VVPPPSTLCVEALEPAGVYGSFVAQSVVEEKATRIIEILLATVRPSRLLTARS